MTIEIAVRFGTLVIACFGLLPEFKVRVFCYLAGTLGIWLFLGLCSFLIAPGSTGIRGELPAPTMEELKLLWIHAMLSDPGDAACR
jgi:hypothetical protein